MIISRTPFRISFFGGGTDYPAWYRNHGGTVLATTINKYCYISCRYLPPFFEHRIRLVYSKIENCQALDEIAHPSVREVLRYLNIERGVEIHHDGDLPARSGMGSSSAFTVGLLHALYALKGHMPNKQQLATESIYVEQERLKENVGSQDQVLAAHGGFNHVVFSPDGRVSVRPMTLARERVRELNSHLMLFYTGIKRTASDIAESYIKNIESKERQLHRLGEMVEEGISILSSGQDISRFGKLLHESWQAKRSLSAKVSNSHVEEIYNEAMSAGAIGGKLIGAGGGGFLLLFVHPPDQNKVRERLTKLLHVPFQFEFSGSQIIFFDPEEDYSAEEKARANQTIQAFQELTDNPT
ncbi:MAG: kinase [Nitrospirae bacterium]|nr:kinase [Nitrospirota bacterium]